MAGIATASLSLVPTQVVAASPPQLVVNLRPGEGSEPRGFVESGGVVFFAANDPAHGRELWRTDGTPEGTSLVADIHPGPEGSDPSSLMAFRDGVVLAADDGQGTAIWRAGGTIEGASPLARGDVWPLAISGGRIFAVQNGQGYAEQRLVLVDPDTGATAPVGDLGPKVHSMWHPFDLDGTLFLTVDRQGQARTELWATDGTDQGTRSLGTIGDTGEELSDFWPIEGMDQFTAFRSKVWFVRHWQDGADCEGSGDLWVSDGTRQGTRRAAEVLGRIGPCISDVTTVGDQLRFASVRRGSRSVTEVWTTDGTREGTSIVATYRRNAPEQLGRLGDELLFELNADDEDDPPGLWATDGTASGTRPITVLEDEPSAAPQVGPGERAFFVRQHDELWVTDGTAAGTGRLVDLQDGGDWSDILDLSRLGPLAIFTADDGSTGSEPWASDGSVLGTRMLRDINPIDEGSAPTGLTPTDVSLFLSAQVGSPTTAPRLWGIAPTYRTGDPRSWMTYPEAVGPASMTVLGRRVVFAAQGERGGDGVELWSVDDEGHGGELKDIRPASPASYPTDLVVMGRRVYFVATSRTGRDLWATDGTAKGTVRVRNLRVPARGAPRGLVVAGDRLFFTAGDTTHGRELWTSDGTADGTRLVADIRAGAHGSAIAALTAVGGSVYFRANDGTHGSELWTSDGTESGTRQVVDLRAAGGSRPDDLTAVGDVVYFVATD
ncbi:MAG: ELWxxDGT repeat protein, partial [Chloroflexota bacterium]